MIVFFFPFISKTTVRVGNETRTVKHTEWTTVTGIFTLDLTDTNIYASHDLHRGHLENLNITFAQQNITPLKVFIYKSVRLLHPSPYC